MLIGIIGGTGAAGKALARRMSSLGHDVLLGSREAARASEAAGSAGEDGMVGTISGVANAEAADAEIVFFSMPWEGAVEAALEHREALSGKTVVSIVNAMMKVGREVQPVIMSRGSVAQSIQSVLPQSNVVSALHHVPARELGAVARPLDIDVLVCSDNSASRLEVIELLNSIPGLNALDGGSLSNSGAIESMTAVLVNLNIRYKARTALRITGLSETLR